MLLYTYEFLSFSLFLPMACDTPTSAPVLLIKTNEFPNQAKKPAVPTAATAALPALPIHIISTKLYAI